jgi:hypothetical protein
LYAALLEGKVPEGGKGIELAGLYQQAGIRGFLFPLFPRQTVYRFLLDILKNDNIINNENKVQSPQGTAQGEEK